LGEGDAAATGEEGETCVQQSRAKLFELLPSSDEGKKEWKERGCGQVKLNVATAVTADTAAAGTEKKARLIMREDRVKKALLNAPVNGKVFKLVSKAEAHIIFTGLDLEQKHVTSYLLKFTAAAGKTGADINKAFIQSIEKCLSGN
jgi:hypothetical protein